MTDYSATLLCCAIIEQSAIDYRKLVREGQEKIKTKFGSFSRREIDRFYHSEWGETIVSGTMANYTAEDVYDMIKATAKNRGLTHSIERYERV